MSRRARASLPVAARHRSCWHHAEDLLQCQTLSSSSSSASSWLPRATMRGTAASCCSSPERTTLHTLHGFIPRPRTGCVWGKAGHSVLSFYGLKSRLFCAFRARARVCVVLIWRVWRHEETRFLDGDSLFSPRIFIRKLNADCRRPLRNVSADSGEQMLQWSGCDDKSVTARSRQHHPEQVFSETTRIYSQGQVQLCTIVTGTAAGGCLPKLSMKKVK